MEISTFSTNRLRQSWIIPQARTHTVEHTLSGQVRLCAKDRKGKTYQVRLTVEEVEAIHNGINLGIA